MVPVGSSIRVVDGVGHLVDADRARRQLARVHVDAHRELLRPKMLTCATPLTIEIRCATCDCAISSSTASDSVDDRRTMKKID